MVLNTKNQDTRYWCEYCRIFVYNNRINREKHEASPQHTANFKKRVETLRREEQELQRNKAVFGGSVKGSEGANANSSFYNKTTAASSASGSTSGIKNVLSIKTATETQTQKKKPILGLGINENKVKTAVIMMDSGADGSAAVNLNLMVKTSNFIDIKTATKDLKRKIIEDEEKSRSLPTTDTNTEQQHVKDQDQDKEEDKEEEEINVEGLFKKKKTKKESS